MINFFKSLIAKHKRHSRCNEIKKQIKNEIKTLESVNFLALKDRMDIMRKPTINNRENEWIDAIDEMIIQNDDKIRKLKQKLMELNV